MQDIGGGGGAGEGDFPGINGRWRQGPFAFAADDRICQRPDDTLWHVRHGTIHSAVDQDSVQVEHHAPAGVVAVPHAFRLAVTRELMLNEQQSLRGMMPRLVASSINAAVGVDGTGNRESAGWGKRVEL